jgi:hypothetical protein
LSRRNLIPGRKKQITLLYWGEGAEKGVIKYHYYNVDMCSGIPKIQIKKKITQYFFSQISRTKIQILLVVGG